MISIPNLYMYIMLIHLFFKEEFVSWTRVNAHVLRFVRRITSQCAARMASPMETLVALEQRKRDLLIVTTYQKNPPEFWNKGFISFFNLKFSIMINLETFCFRNVEIASEGECPKPCACILMWKPVCGVDGKTYANDCVAQCEYVFLILIYLSQ